VRVGQPFSPNRCLSSDLVHPTGGSRPVSAKLCLPMRIVIDALSPGLWWPRRNLNVKLAGWVLDGANPHGPPRGGDRRYIFSALLVQPGRSWRRAARSPWDGVVAFDDALGLSPRYGSASIHQWTSTGTGRRRAAPVLPERCRLTVRHGDLSGQLGHHQPAVAMKRRPREVIARLPILQTLKEDATAKIVSPWAVDRGVCLRCHRKASRPTAGNRRLRWNQFP
jgi:hypothetical protein